MKYKILFLLICLPFLSRAQKINLDSLERTVLNELMESWTLGVDSNSNTVNIGIYNQYKKLFDLNAKVDDDLNIQYVPAKNSGSYQVIAASKDFDIYAHDVALEVSKISVDIDKPESKKTNFTNNNIYEVTRTVYVEKPAKYVLKDIDALAHSVIALHTHINFEKKKGGSKESAETQMLDNLRDKLRKNPDSVYKFSVTSLMNIKLVHTKDAENPVKIISIANSIKSVKCLNDDDGDGVLNLDDVLPNKYGDFTANGEPDEDLDGVADTYDKCKGTFGTKDNDGCPNSYFTTDKKLEGFIGYQFNDHKMSMPALNKLGYQDENGFDAIDVLQSKKGNLKNPGPSTGINAGADFTWFFGKNKRQAGLSIGFRYTSFSSFFELSEKAEYTYKSFDGYDFYRRQISINILNELIDYQVYNFPVQLSYRFKAFSKDKWAFNVKAGPSLMIFSYKSNYHAIVDVGGIYQIDTLSQNKITWYNYFTPGSTWNVYMTSSGINEQNTNPGAAAIFTQLNNSSSKELDFTYDKQYHSHRILSRNAIAFNFSFDGQYKGKKESPLAIKFGIHCAYAPLFERKDNYKPIERTSDKFNSIFNSSAPSRYFAYGINIGLIYDL